MMMRPTGFRESIKAEGSINEVDMMVAVDKQVSCLTSLTGDLLDVTKINSGTLKFNDAVFDLRPMVKELIDDLHDTAVVYGDRERIWSGSYQRHHQCSSAFSKRR